MANLNDRIFESLYEGIAQQIIESALLRAKETMKSMCANEGQTSVIINSIIPDFELNAYASPEEGWQDVDAGEYMTFVGQIVEAGNSIMKAAYTIARKIVKVSSAI